MTTLFLISFALFAVGLAGGTDLGSVDGGPGVAPGGGGGGASSVSTDGGAGANGRLLITW